MAHDTPSQARERVLNVAERLFSERGYKAVTLRDIAVELGIRQASLYHHVPGGKEALFVEVSARGLQRHRHELERAIGQAGPQLRDQLLAAGEWLLSQPPVNVGRMAHSDMPAIDAAHAQRLTQQVYEAVILPLDQLFRAAGIAQPDPTLLAGSYLAIVEAIREAQRYTDMPRAAMLRDMVDVLLHGVQPGPR